jgi:hypothetical protein
LSLIKSLHLFLEIYHSQRPHFVKHVSEHCKKHKLNSEVCSVGALGLSLSGIKKGITGGWGLKRKEDFILRGSKKRLEKVEGFPGRVEGYHYWSRPSLL